MNGTPYVRQNAKRKSQNVKGGVKKYKYLCSIFSFQTALIFRNKKYTKYTQRDSVCFDLQQQYSVE